MPYLNTKGEVVISKTATPSNIIDITESNALSVNSGNSIRFSPFQGGGLSINYDSLATEDSGRSVDGEMHITWILSRARKVEIQLPPCSATFASKILDRVMGRKYYITYWDLITNSEKTIHVYTSNGKGSLYSGVIRNGVYQGITFNAIELKGET